MALKRLAILGSTGSIGRSALAVVDAHPDRLAVAALAAGDNVDLFAEQLVRYAPRAAAVASPGALDRLRDSGVPLPKELGAGSDGLVQVASHPDADIVICATAGSVGLDAVLAAVDAGKTVAIANKEVLVMAGQIVTAAARARGAAILPIDSEHNAIHQCLHGRQPSDVRRLVLTASGGPFRGRTPEDLARVSPDDALQHPTWRMGRKITIDSATLMNKGLEVIEARWLFDVPADRVDVVVHPQSIVHSMVELVDGSIIAQLGVTDMRLPIQYACSYPERWTTPLPTLDLVRAGRLEFEAPSHERFPCLRLAYRAIEAGPSMPCVLNAANEVAVEAFLAGRLAFTDIPAVIRAAMDAHPPAAAATLDEVRAVDAWARARASEAVQAAGRAGSAPAARR
ncbi:MAG: 1-deoxy-D-xylulose-5-phosphate reductoisomerase [Acidimicrobiia bacterium]|nr:1-deoxy-D-xylulose-5-phosphate reductoisomerase [Acidimicrobiia bacterium]